MLNLFTLLLTFWGMTGYEFMVDPNLKYVPQPSYQEESDCAFGNSNYLTVWMDLRKEGETSIYCARVDENGNVLDPAGIPVTNPLYGQGHPKVAFDGTNWFVIWTRGGAIYGSRVTTDGVVLDYGGFLILGADKFELQISFDGTNYLIVWIEDGNGWDVYASRVDTDGIALDPDGIEISTFSEDQKYPAVTFGGNSYLIVWKDERNLVETDVYGARLRTDGVLLDTTGIGIGISPPSDTLYHYSLNCSFDGTNYFVVWDQKSKGAGNSDIYGARVDQSGTVIDTYPFIPISLGLSDPDHPCVSFDGINYYVVWEDDRVSYQDLYGTQVTPDGSVVNPNGTPISTEQYDQIYPAIDGGNSTILIVWEDHRYGDTNADPPDVFGARINLNGTVVDPEGICISTAAYQEFTPQASFNGNNYLVVWEDFRNWEDAEDRVQPDIYGARITPSGVNLDPTGIPILNRLSDRRHHLNPKVTFGEDEWLVVWSERRGVDTDVYARRVASDGTLPGDIILLRLNATLPDVAYVGGYYFTVMENDDNLWGIRLSTDCAILDSFCIMENLNWSFGASYGIAITSDGTNFFAVWSQGEGSQNYNIYGARITPDAVVLDTIEIYAQNGIMFLPQVAFDGVNYTVVWTHYIEENIADIYGARVTTDGQVIDTIPVLLVSQQGFAPDIAFTENKYILVWQIQEDYAQVAGAEVSTELVLTDTIDVSSMMSSYVIPTISVASGPDSQALMVYSVWTDNPCNDYRIWGNLYPDILPGIGEEHTKNKTSDVSVYPNPFNTTTSIQFTVNSSQSAIEKDSQPLTINCQLQIYDLSGRLIEMTKNNVIGENLAPGIYFLKIKGYNPIKIVKLK